MNEHIYPWERPHTPNANLFRSEAAGGIEIEVNPWEKTGTRDRGTEPQHKKVVITLAVDRKPCGAKHYAVQHDGSIAKDICTTSSGIMLVLESTVAAAATRARPDIYAICSVPKGKPIDPEAPIDFGVNGSGAPLTRSGKHFEFRPGVPGMMVFDLDPKGSDECVPALEYKDPAAYHAALVGICPELGNADAAHQSMLRYVELEKASVASLKSLAEFYERRARFADEATLGGILSSNAAGPQAQSPRQ
jgi:hypothetical protein